MHLLWFIFPLIPAPSVTPYKWTDSFGITYIAGPSPGRPGDFVTCLEAIYPSSNIDGTWQYFKILHIISNNPKIVLGFFQDYNNFMLVYKKGQEVGWIPCTNAGLAMIAAMKNEAIARRDYNVSLMTFTNHPVFPENYLPPIGTYLKCKPGTISYNMWQSQYETYDQFIVWNPAYYQYCGNYTPVGGVKYLLANIETVSIRKPCLMKSYLTYGVNRVDKLCRYSWGSWMDDQTVYWVALGYYNWVDYNNAFKSNVYYEANCAWHCLAARFV